MVDHSARQAFTAALETLVARVRQDRSILAALLCGSLAHDTVWAKSDIDLVLVTIDDGKTAPGSMALYADGVNVHAFLIPRTEFRRMVEGSVQNSFMHALLAKGRLLYTHDEIDRAAVRGTASARRSRSGDPAPARRDRRLPAIYKAHKWLVTRGDLDYTALWILYAATSLAQIEVIGAGMVADREVIPQAMKLNPPLFETIYVRPAEHEEEPRRASSRRSRRSTTIWRRARRRSSRPSSTTSARPARRGRARRSRITSSATSTSAR